MKTLQQLSLANKRVLVRLDLNVPLDEKGGIRDTTRITAALPTLRYILSQNASVVILSHLGRPKCREDFYSLVKIVPVLQKLLDRKVHFVNSCVDEAARQKSSQLKSGEVLLLENVRFYKEESLADPHFAQTLAQHGDLYINDAFGTAHRNHASTTEIAKHFTDKAYGMLIAQEIESISQVLDEPRSPFVAIVGGAKTGDKISLLSHLLRKADTLLVGGGMSHTFVHAQGGETGTSLLEQKTLPHAHAILQQAKQSRTSLLLPTDAVIAQRIDTDAPLRYVAAHRIPEHWMGLDIGPKSIEKFCKSILSAKTILWNGPMGVAELSAFSVGTQKVAQAVALATQKGAFSLVGGGDSLAALHKLDLQAHISHLSTGGGALLQVLSGQSLPALEALKV